MSGIKKFFIGLLVSSPRFSDKTFTLNSYFQVVLGVIVCVVVGIMIYQNQQENSRKRFYWWTVRVLKLKQLRLRRKVIWPPLTALVLLCVMERLQKACQLHRTVERHCSRSGWLKCAFEGVKPRLYAVFNLLECVTLPRVIQRWFQQWIWRDNGHHCLSWNLCEILIF